MKRSIFLGISAFALILVGAGLGQVSWQAQTAYAQAAGSQVRLPLAENGQPLPSLAPLVEATKPAVVSIAVERPARSSRSPFQGDPFFERFFRTPPQQQREPDGPRPAGSGVIVDAARGLVLTNHHVIQNTEAIEVTLSDGRTYAAEIVGSDAATDVALLELETADDLTEMPLGDSEELLVGDFVLAIGNPFGLTHTVTSGIVSALGRDMSDSGRFSRAARSIQDFIQTDASINPGNSGGALVNMRGELVGIPSSMLSGGGGNIGIGFAVPTNIARGIMRQLLEFGEVRRGLLGVIPENVDEELAEVLGLESATGAHITEVIPDSAAEKAGIEAGDVILQVEGRDIETATDLIKTVALRSVGEEISLEIVDRDGRTKTIRAVLGALVSAAGEEIHPALRGASLVDSEAGEIEGVMVESVAGGSSADRSGLRAEDLIVNVNRQRIVNVEQMKDVARNKSLLVLDIRRQGRRVRISVRS